MDNNKIQAEVSKTEAVI